MEICILKAYQFLYGNTIYEKACVRLAKMMRGIGNPLVAAYARAYLARRGLEVLPTNKEYLSICFNDQVAALVIQTKNMDKILEKMDQQARLPPSLTLSLIYLPFLSFTPALSHLPLPLALPGRSPASLIWTSFLLPGIGFAQSTAAMLESNYSAAP